VAFLIGTMLGIGLRLEFRALTGAWRDVRLVGVALALNFLVAPALAWLVARGLFLAESHATGLLLLGGGAGAPFLPKVATLARADGGSAVGLMVLLTLGTIAFLPLVLPWMIPDLPPDPWAIARPLIFTVLLPLFAGMAFRSVSKRFADRIGPACSGVGTASLGVVFVLLVALNLRGLAGLLGSAALFAVVLYLLTLFAAGWWLSAARREVRALQALAVTSRNFGAAFVPATLSLRNPDVSLMLTASAIASLAFCFTAATWLRRTRSAIPIPRGS